MLAVSLHPVSFTVLEGIFPFQVVLIDRPSQGLLYVIPRSCWACVIPVECVIYAILAPGHPLTKGWRRRVSRAE